MLKATGTLTLAIVLVGVVVLGSVVAPVAADADGGNVRCRSRVICRIEAGTDGDTGQNRDPAPDPDRGGQPTTPPKPCTAPRNFCPGGTSVVGPALSPEQLAEHAVTLLLLSGPQIGVAPAPDGAGLVGLPVWLWTEQTARTWGPIERTASVRGLSVTARAEAQSISWDMGDGHTVGCDGPGTPYTDDQGFRESPDCGYRYERSSRTQPDGTYTLTGTTSWRITWWVVGGGQTGVIDTTADSSTTVTIKELQVVTQ